MLINRDGYGPDGRRVLFLDFGGDDSSAPTPDPLVGKAAQQSADLADRIYADNREWLGELKPLIRENMATQSAASRDAYEQSRIDRADYNTLGRPAIKRQAIGHGLTRYVDDATAENLYDLYAAREGMVRSSAPAATASATPASVAGAQGTAGAVTVAGGAGDGLINYNGRQYSPTEFSSMVTASLGPNLGGPQGINALPGASEALARAGYQFDPLTGITASGSSAPGAGVSSTAGTTAEVKRSEGFPAQPAAVASGGGGGSDPQLNALLKSAGIKPYQPPGYAVTFSAADGTAGSVSPEQALKSVNAWRGTSNRAAAANAEAQLKALAASGYKLVKNADGSYAFDGDPKEQYAALTKVAKDSYDSQVATLAKNAGITTEAENEKAIWKAETGLEKVAVDTESRRAADAAGTDVTQAISRNNSMLERQARGMVGFDPNKFARTIASNGVNLNNTALLAGGMNTARENARREVIGMSDAGTTNTINTTRGLPSQAINWSSSGKTQGDGAVGNGVAGITANNTAVAPALQGWGQVGQLGMAKYNADVNAYNVNQQNAGGGIGTVIGLAKGGMDIANGARALGWIGSDRRMKEHIALVGKDERTGLNIYEFNYIGDGTRMRGVMADEVERIMPDAVAYDDLGFASVNYGALGLEMVEV